MLPPSAGDAALAARHAARSQRGAPWRHQSLHVAPAQTPLADWAVPSTSMGRQPVAQHVRHYWYSSCSCLHAVPDTSQQAGTQEASTQCGKLAEICHRFEGLCMTLHVCNPPCLAQMQWHGVKQMFGLLRQIQNGQTCCCGVASVQHLSLPVPEACSCQLSWYLRHDVQSKCAEVLA